MARGDAVTPIKQQILQTLDVYAKECMLETTGGKPLSPALSKVIELTVKQAMLSGMSITSHYLMANDGHPHITPQLVNTACLEIGREMGLQVEQLRKGQSDVSDNPG